MRYFKSLIGLLATSFILSGCSFEPKSESSSRSYEPPAQEAYFKVDWRDYDNSLLHSEMVLEGETPKYEWELPTREKDDGYIYTFSSWDKEPTPIHSDQTYIAQYTKEVYFNDSWFVLNETGNYYSFKFVGRDDVKRIDIPNSCNGLPVKGLYFNKSGDCPLLEEINMPDSIEFIYNFSFSEPSFSKDAFPALKRINFSKNLKFYYGSDLLCANFPGATLEDKIDYLRQMNVFEDDNGIYLPIGDNNKAILCYSKNGIIDPDCQIIACSPNATSIDLRERPKVTSLAYLDRFYEEVYTNDIVDSFFAERDPQYLYLGKNVRVVNEDEALWYELIIGRRWEDVPFRFGNLGYEYDAFQPEGERVDEVEMSSENPYYVLENGILYTKDKSVLLYASNNLKDEVAIDESTKRIAKNAFYQCRHITRIHLNEGLEIIGGGAFSYCYSLGDVELPDTLYACADSAFEYCPMLFRIALGKSLGRGDAYADRFLSNMDNLCEIINHSEYIDDKDLSSFGLIENFDDSKIIYYEDYGFYVYDPSGEGTSDETYLLHTDQKTKNVVLKEEYSVQKDEEVVEAPLFNRIRPYAFYGCLALESLTIDSSKRAYYWEDRVGIEHCHNLRTLTYKMGEIHLIKDCPELENIFINAESAKYIGDCSYLLQLPKLKFNTYRDCNYLGSEEYPYMVLMNRNKYEMDTIEFHPDCRGISSVAYPSELYDVYCPFTHLDIPGSIARIHEYAFDYCPNLESLVLHEGLEYIEKSNFGSAKIASMSFPSTVKAVDGLHHWQQLTSLTFPNNCWRIGNFWQCPLLSYVCVGKKAQLYTDAFMDSPLLKEICVRSDDGTINSKEMEYYLNAGERTVRYVDSEGTTIEKLVLTGLEGWKNSAYIISYKFANVTGLKEIQFNCLAEGFGEGVFSHCVSLETIYYPVGTKDEWNEIPKDDNWLLNAPKFKVVCSDGTITY